MDCVFFFFFFLKECLFSVDGRELFIIIGAVRAAIIPFLHKTQDWEGSLKVLCIRLHNCLIRPFFFLKISDLSFQNLFYADFKFVVHWLLLYYYVVTIFYLFFSVHGIVF